VSAIVVLSALSAATLTGCGLGTLDASSPQVAQVIPAFKGSMMGGQAPIIGATLKIYATGSDGACTSSDSAATCIASDTTYGTGTFLQEATVSNSCGTSGTSPCSPGQETDTSGNFSFAGGYFCPAGEFAYIVGSGGTPSGSSATPNSKILLVAALGRCEDLYNAVTGGYSGYKGSSVYVNEITTVAAGYALGNFASVSGSTVGIGASSTNNAPKSTGGTTTAPAGLYHAFLNAANLANPFSAATLVSAPTVSPANANAVVPAALINTIANILANCVDSTGSTGQCAGLPGNSDTFTAVKTLAANPTLGGSGVAVSNLFNLPTNSAPFSPILTAAPNDFSIGINYTSGLVYPISGAVDVNDNFYLGNQSAASPAAAGSDTLVSFNSNGTVVSTVTLTAPKYTYGVSVDSLGNGYYANGSASGNNVVGVFAFTASTGAIAASPTIKTVNSSLKGYATAVDKSNNVWVAGIGTAASSNLVFKSAAGAASFGSGYAVTGFTTFANPKQMAIAIDPNQNVWTAFSNTTSGGTVAVVPYTGSAYTTPITNTSVSGTPAIGITFGSVTGSSEVAYLSSYTTPDIQPFTATLTSGQVTGVSSGTATTASSTILGSIYNATDGAGTIWIADTNSASVINYNPTNGTAYRYQPCLVTTNGSNVTCVNSLAGKPYEVALDSTGSMWVTNPAGANVVQIIGSAAPTWPLLSLGKYGVSP
jgi:hypothetical protein